MTEKITLDELRAVSNLLFDYLEKCGHHSIDLDKDYYWVISEKDRYDPYENPKDVSLGQLYDDWHDLRNVMSGKFPPIAHHLVRLSSILSYVGERIVK